MDQTLQEFKKVYESIPEMKIAKEYQDKNEQIVVVALVEKASNFTMRASPPDMVHEAFYSSLGNYEGINCLYKYNGITIDAANKIDEKCVDLNYKQPQKKDFSNEKNYQSKLNEHISKSKKILESILEK